MEDYTYHLIPGEERILGAHMLEICPSIAADTPSIEIHPLSIGNREDPVRMVFDAAPDPAVVIGMADLGDRFRLVANEVDAVPPDHPLPNLPVARAVRKPRPNLPLSRSLAHRRRPASHRPVRGRHHRRARRPRHHASDRTPHHRQHHRRSPTPQGDPLEPGLPPPGPRPHLNQDRGIAVGPVAPRRQLDLWSTGPTSIRVSPSFLAANRVMSRSATGPAGNPSIRTARSRSSVRTVTGEASYQGDRGQSQAT